MQKVFNQISLQKDEELWMSDDDTRTCERLQLVAEFPETQFGPQLKLDCVASCKNPKLSMALREKGNLFYAQGDTDRALQMYNQSLQFAIHDPDDIENIDDIGTRELAITYANRSAVWADRKEYTLAIRDADFAFQNEYPEDLHFKLFERKGQCLSELGNAEEAKVAINLAIASLEKSSLKGERRKAKLLSLEKMVQEVKAKEPVQDFIRFNHDLLPKLESPKECFPSFNEGIEVKYEKSRGRFCVAKRPIEIGEIVAVEKPYVWMLDREEVKTMCWHCFRPVISPVPCKFCAGVLFCGPECRTQAMDGYHQYECGITEVIYQAQIGGWALAYRAVISKPLEFFLYRKQEFSKRNELMGVSEGQEYNSEDIMTFHNLVTHDDVGNKLAPELMMQATTAIFLLRCLKRKSYYKNPDTHEPGPGGVLTDVELFLAQLLHHFMRVTYYNTHEITTATMDTDIEEDGGFNMTSNSPERLQLRRIGRATNPTLALLNHSCDPNYRRVSWGKYTIGFATKNIQEGEEITDTYCPTFAAASKGEKAGESGKVQLRLQLHPMQTRMAYP